MSFLVPRSRFTEFKDDFLKETGKSADENPELYAMYVTARFADQNNRTMSTIIDEMKELQKVIKKI
jgi:hypothetical protein